MSTSTHAGSAPLIQVRDLSLSVGAGGSKIVQNVTFNVAHGEIVGVVGESGSGKTQVARAVLGLTAQPLLRTGGSIRFNGEELTTMSEPDIRRLRGSSMGMVFQEPMTSLNPSMKIGRQLDEGLALHRKELNAAERRKLILAMLAKVGIRSPEQALTAWPHEFSGGMRQRIMIAGVMLLSPALLLADEPTTALDAVVQRDVLEMMVELTRANNTAVLMISHDLAMVAHYTERVIVMQNGVVVEEGKTEQLLAAPQHSYTRKLLSAMPRRGPARSIARATPLLSVRDLVMEYPARAGLFRSSEPMRALKGVSLDVYEREIVAVVGGSGSGKTTLGRIIAGLLRSTGGDVMFRGKPIHAQGAARADYRLNCQMVFQDPYSSLSPRMTIFQLVGEGLRHLPDLSARQRTDRVHEVLSEVGLNISHASRYPHELSGGQRQRVAIARALVRRPSFVIADEPVSALDVTVRAQVLELLASLQERQGFACLFISHDLSVVEQVADKVVVMQHGQIIERGTRDEIFDQPCQEYTRDLLAAIPTLHSNQSGGVSLHWRLNESERRTKPLAIPIHKVPHHP